MDMKKDVLKKKNMFGETFGKKWTRYQSWNCALQPELNEYAASARTNLIYF